MEKWCLRFHIERKDFPDRAFLLLQVAVVAVK